MAGQLGLLLGALDEDNGGMEEVLLGVGIVEEALGSGIAAGLDEIIATEEGVQETPVGYSMYNNYVKPN